jgi:hypothetical protein
MPNFENMYTEPAKRQTKRIPTRNQQANLAKHYYSDIRNSNNFLHNSFSVDKSRGSYQVKVQNST